MTILRFASAATTLLLVVACSPDRDALGPRPPAGPAFAAVVRPVDASGHFDAVVDFSTVSFTPKGANCLLEVNGKLVFTGTIQGTATGRTSALEFASCDQVAVNPPGTFPDRFKSDAEFVGTINGQPAKAHMYYMGDVEVGGHINGRLVFSNGVAGVLDADAIVAVGGSYSGSVVVAPR